MMLESFLQVLELLPGPALVVGLGGEVLGLNDQAECWLGSGRDRIVGRPLAGFVSDPPERLFQWLDECARAAGKVPGTLTTPGAGGIRRVEAIAARVPNQTEMPAAMILHIIPDDEREVLRDRLRRAEGLINRLAHDLRNPVAALSSALNLSRQATATEDVAWAQDAMGRQIENLLRQVDELLEFARLARGKVALSTQKVDAASAARAASASSRPMLDQRGLQLTLAMAPGDLAIMADPRRLEQMLAVMIEHVAGSARPSALIRLAVARERDEVVFRVGHGNGNTPTLDEAAVGPMLIQQLAEAQGGSASGPDPSGTLIIRLPAAAASASRSGTVDDRRAAVAKAGARILVVDDNIDTARGTARLLQLGGHDVQVAHDGRQALELADAYQPRLILLDISLPVMDGYEVARQLRSNPRHRDVIIIAVSGYSADDIRPPGESGFDHHLVKPVDFDALRAIIDQAGA